MNQTFDACFQFHECAVIGDVGNAALVHGAQGVLRFNSIPRIGLQLLHAEADAVRVLVDLDDLHFDSLTNGKDFRRVVDAAPCHVGHVQQAVNAAQIHKRTVFGDVLDHAVNRLAFGEVGDHFGALFCAGLFKDRTTRDNDVATATVHLEDLEGLLHAHQRACVAHGAHVNLAAGKEGNCAAQIDSKAALDAAEDRAIDAGLVRIGLFQTVPSFFALGLVTADLCFAAGVFHAVEEHFDFVANADVSGATDIGKFFQIDAAFHLVANVDDGLARFNRDNLAFDNGPFLGRVDLEALSEEGFEFFHGVLSSHVNQFPFRGCHWPCGWLRRSLKWSGPNPKARRLTGTHCDELRMGAYSAFGPCWQGREGSRRARPRVISGRPR